MQIMHSSIKYFALSTLCETDVRETSYWKIVRSCNDKNDQLDAENREDIHDCVVFVAPKKPKRQTQLLQCNFSPSAFTHSPHVCRCNFAVCWFMRPFCWHMLNTEPITNTGNTGHPIAHSMVRLIISVPYFISLFTILFFQQFVLFFNV